MELDRCTSSGDDDNNTTDGCTRCCSSRYSLYESLEITTLASSSFAVSHEKQKPLINNRRLVVAIGATLGLLLMAIIVRTVKTRRPVLNFRPISADGEEGGSSSSLEWKFKVLQITDIHLGENSWTDWGPEQDRKTWLVLESVILSEAPDLIVLSGDQITANNIFKNATVYYRQLGRFLSRYNTPWAMIFGNHDDMDFEVPDGTNKTIPHKYSRKDLLRVDQSFPLSLSQAGPSNVFGTTNYVLNIYLSDGKTAAAQIYLLDSGGGSLPQQVDESQIQWLEQQIEKSMSLSSASSPLPALAFQHIPPGDDGLQNCQGYQGEGIAGLEFNAGIMETLSKYDDRFIFLAVGHNHGNDCCCQYQSSSLELCFGRHSGYGGYGNWSRGSRVYELTFQQQSNSGTEEQTATMSWKSWVRLESGEIIDQVSPQ